MGLSLVGVEQLKEDREGRAPPQPKAVQTLPGAYLVATPPSPTQTDSPWGGPRLCMEPKGMQGQTGPLWLWRLPARMEREQMGHHRVKKGLPAQAGRQAGQN